MNAKSLKHNANKVELRQHAIVRAVTQAMNGGQTHKMRKQGDK